MSWSPSEAQDIHVTPDSEVVELTVPELGDLGMATIVAWMVQEGDVVASDEAICRLAVGDLEFEVHSTADGRLARILVAVGTPVRDGDSLAEVAAASPPPGAPPPLPLEEPDSVDGIGPTMTSPRFEPAGAEGSHDLTARPLEEAAVEANEPVEEPIFDLEAPPSEDSLEEIHVDPETLREFEPPADEDQPPPEPVVELEPEPTVDFEPAPELEPAVDSEPQSEPEAGSEPDVASESPFPEPGEDVDWSRWHSPVVRKLAAEHGIDLAQIQGSGLGGRIRKRDVLAQL